MDTISYPESTVNSTSLSPHAQNNTSNIGIFTVIARIRKKPQNRNIEIFLLTSKFTFNFNIEDVKNHMKCDEFNSSSVEFTILGHLKQSNIKPPPLIGAIQKTTLDSKVKLVTEGKRLLCF